MSYIPSYIYLFSIKNTEDEVYVFGPQHSAGTRRGLKGAWGEFDRMYTLQVCIYLHTKYY